MLFQACNLTFLYWIGLYLSIIAVLSLQNCLFSDKCNWSRTSCLMYPAYTGESSPIHDASVCRKSLPCPSLNWSHIAITTSLNSRVDERLEADFTPEYQLHSPRTNEGDFTRNMQPLRPNFREAMTLFFLLQSDILFCASVLLFGLTSPVL